MATYYFDPFLGSDSNDGLSQATAKQKISRTIGNDYYIKLQNGTWEFHGSIIKPPIPYVRTEDNTYTVVSLYYSEWKTPGQSYNRSPWSWFTGDLSKRLPTFSKTKEYLPYLQDYSNSSWRDIVSTTGATLTKTNSSVIITSTSADPILSPNFGNIDGSVYRYIRIKLSRIGGTTWDGHIYYTTSGHSWSGSYRKNVAQPSSWAGPQTLLFDMHNLSAGGTDWATNTITGIRFDSGNAIGDNFEIYSIELLDVNGNSVKSMFKEHDPNTMGGFELEQKVAYDYGIDVFSNCFYWDGTKNFTDSSFKLFANHQENKRPKFCVMWAITQSANPIRGPYGTSAGVPDLSAWYSLIDHWHDNHFVSNKYWFKNGKPVVMAFLGGAIRVSAALNYGFIASKTITAHTAGSNLVTLSDVTGIVTGKYAVHSNIQAVAVPVTVTAINGNVLTLSLPVATAMTGTLDIREPATVTATTNLLLALDNYIKAKPNSKAPNGIHWTSLNDNMDHPDWFGKVAGATETYTKTIGFSSAGTYNFFDGYVGQTQFNSGGRSSGTTAGYNFKANYIAAGKDPNTFEYQMDLYDNVLNYCVNSGTTIPYFASVMAGWEKTPWTFYATNYTITNATWSNGIATLTINAHPFTNGQKVSIRNINPSGYNVLRVGCTVVNANTIQIPIATNPGVYISGGSIVSDSDTSHRRGTAAQFKQHLLRTKAIMDAAPAVATDKTIMIYAWNEFGEGGYICPTEDYGYELLEAVGTTFGKITNARIDRGTNRTVFNPR